MKKKKTTVRNLVAKHSRTVNKAVTHRDKKKDYRRKDKHNGKKGPKDLFYWINIHMSQIYFKNENTGNAWWPLDPIDSETSFENDTTYRIDKRVYPCDTAVFRNACHEAIGEEMWKMIKKGPKTF